MATIEPPPNDVINLTQLKKNSANLRVWHWINALVITGSLLTVLINSTLLDPHTNADFIKSLLHQEGAIISPEQAGTVARGLEDKVWDIHIYFGYIITGLLLFRIIVEFFQHSDQNFLKRLTIVWKAYKKPATGTKNALHELAVKILYLAFYLLLVVMVLTGLSLAFKRNLGISKSIAHSISEVHGFCMYLFIAFIIVHVAGVLFAERKEGKGIVSDMINGG